MFLRNKVNYRLAVTTLKLFVKSIKMDPVDSERQAYD